MKELSLELDKILVKSLETELNFCLNVKDRFLKSTFDRKISINLFCFCLKKDWESPTHIKFVQLLRIILNMKCIALVGV